MENLDETSENEETPTLIVTEDMRSYIYETARWANFLSIVGFVVTAFMVIAAFTIGSAMNTNPNIASLFKTPTSLGSAGFTVFFLVYAFAIFYPSLLMFKYAAKAKLGILYGEQVSLGEAMGKMKSLFKYYGIVTIILISLYIILIIFSVGAAALMAR
ncbi:MAG: hypothetical protein V4541_11185 [Bacteroidota bacterium]